MSVNFPELTSFGTLIKFAQVLEQAGMELASAAGGMGGCAPWAAALSDCRGRHQKRGQQIEQLRRERLNEVVLQPVEGMVRSEYLPVLELPAGAEAAKILGVVVAFEELSARFYDDAAQVAANVLGGLDRTLRKMAAENRSLATSLRRNQ